MIQVRNRKGFSLIEAVLVVMVVAASYIGFGFLYGNITQQALKADLTVLAVKLAREKMDEIIQTKADSGYASVISQAAQNVTSGSWTFSRSVAVSYLNPTDFSASLSDTGYKKILIMVSWGAGAGDSISLTTMVTNMVPSAVAGVGGGTCP
jgi:type II secretory pathway pseudopilin PulG